MGSLAKAMAAVNPSALTSAPVWIVHDVFLAASEPHRDRYVWQALVAGADGSSDVVMLHEPGWFSHDPPRPSRDAVRAALEAHTPAHDERGWVEQLQGRLIELRRGSAGPATGRFTRSGRNELKK